MGPQFLLQRPSVSSNMILNILQYRVMKFFKFETHTPVIEYLILGLVTVSSVVYQLSHLQNVFDCKVFTRAAPLMFAVNIKTNGNPHHRPWSIGKRLLSSWLPVRSAKDQGEGQRSHTHCKVKAKAKRDRQSS